MDDFSQAFKDRLQEIEAYLDLLESLEKQVQQGTPRIGQSGSIITVQQQRILYSSVYLQLYNLIESTISRCVEAVCAAVVNDNWLPSDLSDNVRREWVRFTARTHTELNYENRLESALGLCEHFVQILPISTFKIEKGGGGNWDDHAIENISVRLGLSLQISPDIYKGIKRPFRNDQGPLAFIKSLRNDLAHGSLSFAECGEGVTVSELRDLAERTTRYLKEVVACFKLSIDKHEFLLPERRPERAKA
jgi:MAE_28990/MAE_18760-like HEPN